MKQNLLILSAAVAAASLVPGRASLVAWAEAAPTVATFFQSLAPPARQRYGPAIPVDGGEPFTIERLAELAARSESIEATLAALPPGLRSRYVLMYRSRSLQGASFEAPRAILFEDDGSFVVSFNGGDPQMRGHDKLEAVQFRETERRWEFREIDFSSGEPRLSEANPRKCLECHQSPRRQDVDPRPNWEPYLTWPGAYAGVDGEPGRRLPDEMRHGPYAKIYEEQSLEPDKLRRFLERIKPSHPRYSSLGAFAPRRTLDLTDVLVTLNDRRVGRLALRTPDWDVFGPVFARRLFCGTDGLGMGVSDGAPPELASSLGALFDRMARRLPLHLLRGSSNALIARGFEARGIDTSDWSMDFKTGGRFAFDDRFGSPSFPRFQLQMGFADAMGIAASDGFGDVCRRLSQGEPRRLERLRESGRLAEVAASLEALLQTPENAFAGGASPETVLRRCASCHSGQDLSVPRIAFDDPRALRAELRRTGYPRGNLLQEISHRLSDYVDPDEQMPPSENPTDGERARLIEHLRALAG